jgi:hypothetical protein
MIMYPNRDGGPFRIHRSGNEIKSNLYWQMRIVELFEEITLKLHPEILKKCGRKEFVVLPYEEFLAIQERLNDADDLMELRKAKRAEGRKRSIPLANVKRKLGLR